MPYALRFYLYFFTAGIVVVVVACAFVAAYLTIALGRWVLGRKNLPESMPRNRRNVEDAKIPTPKELQAALKKLKPEQLSVLKFRISDVYAQHKRSRSGLSAAGAHLLNSFGSLNR
jgi:hypothetical protein